MLVLGGEGRKGSKLRCTGEKCSCSGKTFVVGLPRILHMGHHVLLLRTGLP